MPISPDNLIFALGRLVLPEGTYVETPAMDLHATDFTVATFVTLASTDRRNILLGNWNSPSWQLLIMVNAGGALAVMLRRDMVTNGSNPDQDLLSVASSKTLSAGTKHHVAVTMTWGASGNSPTCTLYLDGEAVGSASPTVTAVAGVRELYALMPTTNPYLIGAKQDGSGQDNRFNGELGYFCVYSAALPDYALRVLANGGVRRDNLQTIEGLGAAAETALIAAGIETYEQLAAMTSAEIEAILDAAGLKSINAGTWPKQAALAAAGDWTALRTLQDKLVGGVRVTPKVKKVPHSDTPTLPEGMKATFMVSPTDGHAADSATVLVWGSHTYWALSYRDNRVGLMIAAYDKSGTIVKTWEKTGARYLYTIEVDKDTERVRFRCQSDAAIDMSWDDLEV